MKYDVLIVGAGASGLYCACSILNKCSVKLAIIDSNESVGKKLLLTGAGRCNLTNSDIDTKYYMTDSSDKLERILCSHSNSDVLEFFRNKLGILVSERNGLYYPSTFRADTVVNAMYNYLVEKGVEFLFNTNVSDISKDNDEYIVNNLYHSKTLVIAVGGASYSQTGSNGSIIRLTESFVTKNDVIPLYPALVPLKTLEQDITEISGSRAYCDITLYEDRKSAKVLATSSGEILFTQYGVSGICVLDVSGFAIKTLSGGKRPVLLVNFLKMSLDDAIHAVGQNVRTFPDRSVVKALSGLLRDDILKIILERLKIDIDIKSSALSDKDIRRIADNMTSFKLTVTGNLTFDNAQVTCGGIRLSSLGDNLEIPGNKGLFICGESLNCNGICGGYNLQFCWSSASVAAEGVLSCLN